MLRPSLGRAYGASSALHDVGCPPASTCIVVTSASSASGTDADPSDHDVGVRCSGESATDGGLPDSTLSPTMRSKTADAAAERLRPAFAAASLLLVALLAVLAYALASAQHQQRKDINKRFEDRARVAAAVNESLFSLASTTVKPSDIKTFGGATVAQHPLQQRTAVQQQFYAAILSSSGRILAKAGTVPADVASHP